MAKLKAIIFDLDGTLRDTRELIYAAMEYAFHAHGLVPPTVEELAPYIHHHSFVHQRFASDVSFEAFEVPYGQKVKELLPGVQLYEGAKQVLEELTSKGYKLAIVTAARSAPQDVKEYGIDGYLDVLVSAGDISAHKPDPEGTLLALDRLGVKASEAIMIGDMATDMRAGQAAGLAATVGITHGLGSRESLEEAGASYVIDSLAELVMVVRKIEAAKH